MTKLLIPPTIRVAACDLNGQMRGKRLPAEYAEKLGTGAVRLPLSALNVDIRGLDIEASPLVFESGDADGVLLPTGRGPVPMPWLEHASVLYPMAMHHDDGAPFAGDPRHALARVLEGFSARGLTVIAATELEFTLVDDSTGPPRAPKDPQSGHRLHAGDVVSLAALDAFDAFFSDLYAAAEAMEIPAQAAISEGGVGQFEINLAHREAMRAADDAWLFKALIRGMARRHGLAATFMAKPFPGDAGNGMHVHFSVQDEAGQNIFDDGGPEGTPALRHAIAGCLEAMAPSTLIFAPHANSYARFTPGAHAPTGIAWARENRTAAIRVPGGAPAARRIEHRVAGADVNPYLLLAAILGAALTGLEDSHEPPPPLSGNLYEADVPRLPASWEEAIRAFGESDRMARILPRELIRNLVLTKRQELATIGDLPGEEQVMLYLDRV